MVECNLAKVEVASSNLVSRSKKNKAGLSGLFLFPQVDFTRRSPRLPIPDTNPCLPCFPQRLKSACVIRARGACCLTEPGIVCFPAVSRTKHNRMPNPQGREALRGQRGSSGSPCPDHAGTRQRKNRQTNASALRQALPPAPRPLSACPRRSTPAPREVSHGQAGFRWSAPRS